METLESIERKLFAFKNKNGTYSYNGAMPRMVELLPLLAGLKPVIYLRHIPLKELNHLNDLASFFNLKVFYKALGSSPRSCMDFFMAKDENVIREARTFYGTKRNPNHEALGVLLGYPACCSMAFKELFSYKYKTSKENIERPIYANSKKVNFHFFLNTILMKESRPYSSSVSSKTQNIRLMNSLNKEDPFLWAACSIIPWHPCSYQCRESLAVASEIWKMMRLWPDFTQYLKGLLSNTFLYLDHWRFASLEGSVEENTCSYSLINPPRSLLNKADYDLLERGNLIALEKSKIKVYRNGRQLGSIRATKPLLLPFRD